MVGGVGFEPVSSGQSLIRDNTKHRGWAQSVTYIEFKPTSDIFGRVQDYVPINTANDVTVTAGFSWDGPVRTVSFPRRSSRNRAKY